MLNFTRITAMWSKSKLEEENVCFWRNGNSYIWPWIELCRRYSVRW